MRLAVFALSLATLCAPATALAQDGTTAPTDSTPPPSADCTTADCNTMRNQQDNLNNGSGTPGAQDSLDSGSSGSGTLAPTTPDSSLGGGDRGLSGGNNGGGMSGSGSLGGGSSSGGSSSGGGL